MLQAPAVQSPLVPASLTDRFLAFVIEAVLYLVFITLWIVVGWKLLGLPLFEANVTTEPGVFVYTVDDETITTYTLSNQPFMLLGWLLYCVGFVIMEHRRGQTLGKRVLGLHVVDQASGNLPSIGQSITRLVFFQIGMLGLFIPTLIIMAVSDKNQRTGDTAAKTLVIYRPA